MVHGIIPRVYPMQYDRASYSVAIVAVCVCVSYVCTFFFPHPLLSLSLFLRHLKCGRSVQPSSELKQMSLLPASIAEVAIVQ